MMSLLQTCVSPAAGRPLVDPGLARRNRLGIGAAAGVAAFAALGLRQEGVYSGGQRAVSGFGHGMEREAAEAWLAP